MFGIPRDSYGRVDWIKFLLLLILGLALVRPVIGAAIFIAAFVLMIVIVHFFGVVAALVTLATAAVLWLFQYIYYFIVDRREKAKLATAKQ